MTREVILRSTPVLRTVVQKLSQCSSFYDNLVLENEIVVALKLSLKSVKVVYKDFLELNIGDVMRAGVARRCTLTSKPSSPGFVCQRS